MALTPKRQRFVLEYLKDLNAAAAARRSGSSAKRADQAGYELLSNPEVKAAIDVAMAERAKRTQVTADEVLTALARILRTDRRKLVEYRRTCCRHCHGKDGGYQRTAAEMEHAREQYEEQLDRRKRRLARLKRKGIDLDEDDPDREDPAPFDEKGGVGYDARKPPSPACESCWGDGIAAPYIHDTRTLDEDAASVYAGVKQTQHGIEVLIEERSDALTKLARHLGIDKGGIEIGGDAIIHVNTGVPASPETRGK